MYFTNISLCEEQKSEFYSRFSNLDNVSCCSLRIFTFFVIHSSAHPIFKHRITLHNFVCFFCLYFNLLFSFHTHLFC